MRSPSPFRSQWQLNLDIDFLNHGSFGACPTLVLEAQRRWQDALESDPVHFLAPERELEPKLDAVRAAIAQQVGATPTDLAFVHNATDGVNAVLRSLALQPGDEIVVTDHGYNACNNAARYVAERAGARLLTAQIPFPLAHAEQVLEAIESVLGSRTRLLLIDHVTSPTALILPLAQIAVLVRPRGIRLLVDGAHAPGMIPLDLSRLNVDYYTANHHKWWCAPKASGFLYVHPEWQQEVRPTVISHAANRDRPERSRFTAEFDWNGTFDPTPLLATTNAIDFLSEVVPGGLVEVMQRNRELAKRARRLLVERLGLDAPAPTEMIGSMATLPLPPAESTSQRGVDPLQLRLFDEYRIEVPVFAWPDARRRWLRISAQLYNDLSQYERLADALDELHVRSR